MPGYQTPNPHTVRISHVSRPCTLFFFRPVAEAENVWAPILRLITDGYYQTGTHVRIYGVDEPEEWPGNAVFVTHDEDDLTPLPYAYDVIFERFIPYNITALVFCNPLMRSFTRPLSCDHP
jgi:hypothetical protein